MRLPKDNFLPTAVVADSQWCTWRTHRVPGPSTGKARLLVNQAGQGRSPRPPAWPRRSIGISQDNRHFTTVSTFPFGSFAGDSSHQRHDPSWTGVCLVCGEDSQHSDWQGADPLCPLTIYRPIWAGLTPTCICRMAARFHRNTAAQRAAGSGGWMPVGAPTISMTARVTAVGAGMTATCTWRLQLHLEGRDGGIQAGERLDRAQLRGGRR